MSTAPVTEHPEYLQMMKIWRRCADIYSGLSTADLKAKYLPRWSGEESNAVYDPYWDRVESTDLTNHFKYAIHGIAGLLSQYTLLDTIPSLVALQGNVDLRGNDLRAFLLQQDIWAIRDIASLIIVDTVPRNVDDDTLASEEDDVRPYLAAFPLRNVINWREELVDGRPTLTQVVIRRKVWRPSGDYGQQEVIQHIVHRPGEVELWEQVAGEDGGEAEDGPTLSDTRPILDAAGEPLQQIPCVWYPSLPCPAFSFQVEDNVYIEPPLYSLLKLNLAHFRATSEFVDARRKTNIPIPVLESDLEHPSLKLGTSHFVQVPQGGRFYFVEPTGSALGMTLESIKHLEQQMETASLAFVINNDSPGTQTATEARLQASRGVSGLQVMADLKVSAVQQIGQHWLRYIDRDWQQKIDDLGDVISLNSEALILPPDSGNIKNLLDLQMAGSITQFELRRQLQHSGVMYDKFDAAIFDRGGEQPN